MRNLLDSMSHVIGTVNKGLVDMQHVLERQVHGMHKELDKFAAKSEEVRVSVVKMAELFILLDIDMFRNL